MTDFDEFEQRLAAAIRSDADASVGPFEAGAIADAAIAGTQPGATRLDGDSSRRVARLGRGRDMTLLAAAALLLVGAGLAGSGVLRLPSVVPPAPAPSFGLVAPASPDATSPGPSSQATSSPEPSPTPTPLVWTQASLEQDWPAPVRPEPDGGATDVPIRLKVPPPEDPVSSTCCTSPEFGRFTDPSGDTESSVLPWVDIKEVTFCGSACLTINRVSQSLPEVNPTEQWIAYGIVADIDRDGIPDWRYGVDNAIVAPGCADPSPRVWRTDLHTGRTEWAADTCLLSFPGGIFARGTHNALRFGGESTGGRTYGALPERFYVWASVIQDGRVVATDYAPDVGWLVPSPTAKP
jgi:hypothetical protein